MQHKRFVRPEVTWWTFSYLNLEVRAELEGDRYWSNGWKQTPEVCFCLSRAVGAANARFVRYSQAKASANSTASLSQGSLKTQALHHRASASPLHQVRRRQLPCDKPQSLMDSLSCLSKGRGKERRSNILMPKTKAREKKGCKRSFSGINRNFCDSLAFPGKTSHSPSVGWG